MGSKIAGVVFLFFTVWGMASVIELQYWRNADTYPVWLTKHLRISPENNEKSLIRIGMETFDKVCGDTGASLPSPKNKTVCLCAVMIPPDFFHGSAAFTKSVNQITCWTFNMLPTRLSPVTVDNQYIVSQTAAFSTICCVPDIPSDGVTNDITLETLMTGPCSSRVVRTAGTGYRPDEGPANAQRRQLVLKMLAEI
ncbi:hypothetical protein OB908_26490 [Klebsiella pneumoniae]|nr:hypothetical protein [Klebsiella pneumoniae]